MGQLSELIDALIPDKARAVGLLGYCIGGVVCTEYALRNPSRVSRILFIGPCGLSPKAEAPCQTFVFSCLRPRCRGWWLLCLVNVLAHCCSLPAKYWLRGRTLGICMPDVRDEEACESYCEDNTK